MTLAFEPLLFCFVVPFMLAVGIAVAVAVHRAERRRRAELASLAERFGLRYSPESDRNVEARYPHFECFHRGHSRRALNLISGPLPGRGSEGFSCLLGDFEFRETHGSGKHRRTVTYRFGFAIVEMPWRGLPDLIVRREGVLDRVAGLMGFADLNFESAEFSRRFHVKSGDRRFAYDLIDPRMMEFLLAGEPPSIDVGDPGFCLWYGQGTRLDPAGFEALLRWAMEFLERWPRVLVSRLDEGRRDSSSTPSTGDRHA